MDRETGFRHDVAGEARSGPPWSIAGLTPLGIEAVSAAVFFGLTLAYLIVRELAGVEPWRAAALLQTALIALLGCSLARVAHLALMVRAARMDRAAWRERSDALHASIMKASSPPND